MVVEDKFLKVIGSEMRMKNSAGEECIFMYRDSIFFQLEMF